jgi:hypothetical protein
MVDSIRRASDTSLQIPLKGYEKWTILCIDVLSLFTKNFLLAKSSLKRKNVFELKTIQVCSNSQVRGIYTSDNWYTPENMPKDMDFRKVKGKLWSDVNDFKYIPAELAYLQAGISLESPPKMPKALAKTVNKKMRYDLEQYQNKENNKQGSENCEVWMAQQKSDQFQEGDYPEIYEGMCDEDGQMLRQQPKNNLLNIFKNKSGAGNSEIKKKVSTDYLKPKPIMKLDHVIGFTGKTCPDIKWSKSDTHKLYFASGNTVIRTTIENNFEQEFFLGHTSPVSCLDVSSDNKYLASCQESDMPTVRIFDTETKECLAKADLTKLSDVRC